MNIRILIALVIGLAIQLAQVAPASGSDVSPASVTCACCDSPDSCPCIEQGSPGSGSLPALPAPPSVAKCPIAPSSDGRVAVPARARHGASIPGTTRAWSRAATGYPGVRPSVAFCSFVI